MKVNLDQIEFYHGPSGQLPSPGGKQLPPPQFARSSQPSFATGFAFRPGLFEAPLERGRPSAVTSQVWNAFDIEINKTYGDVGHQTAEDSEPTATTAAPVTLDIPLDLGSYSLALSESAPIKASTPETRQNDLPASNAPGNLFAYGISQQESAKPEVSATGTCGSDCVDAGYCGKDTESRWASDLGGNPCAHAPERAKDVAGTAEATSPASGPSAQSNEYSSPKSSGAPTAPTSDSLVRYPSIAVVVPPPSWKQGAIRTSTRVAAAACNKRLRSGRDVGNQQDRDVPFPNTERPSQKRQKRRPANKLHHSPQGPSIPASCHCSGDIRGLRGSAFLTVESSSGLKPAYYFTFVPDTSPILSRPNMADTPGKQKPYSSDENALLVRLKEREGLSWSEIAKQFPERNMSSLQVHYSTKLRRKASTRPKKVVLM
ncbi:SANT/Myb-like DNA-binding domain-containing protein [Aspergillus ibericus CBS 121593]|uniref:Myb-like domain-containing protein n=1 Tax=Aspergillus ibericus CBS 121593 TaxID=1448316 RepID=A0A395GNL3_9EURO|nr:hypothetical protein BO80DRAFT_505337 [Aspergillus ibericus CBS 121593]RAK96548.1 hypothetical protein BO80DRAFT_505337 [Aspergillus ibericus CBS 121593]